jgi:Na+/proline symporter
MSTLSTHLNWGSSYVVNDFYRRFLRSERPESSPADNNRHYVRASRLTTVALAILSLAISFFVMDSIVGAWNFLLSITGGMGFVLILRWYWWRVNAAAEIASMIAPLAALGGIWLAAWLWPDTILIPDAPENLYIIVPVSIVVILLAMYVTPPEPRQKLLAFYERVQPAGPGWRAITGRSGSGLLNMFVGWIAATVLVYAALFAVGALIFARYFQAAWLVALCAGAGVVVALVLRREFPDSPE